MADLEPTAPSVADPSANATPEPSLAEHEAEFGTVDKRPEPDPDAEPEEDVRRPPRERDDKGHFKPDKHRAAKQQASAGDVPRIQELTKRLRETEAERDALRSRPVSPPPVPPVEKPIVKPSLAAAKPIIDNFQEYGEYVEALADWKIAEARRQDRDTYQREMEAAKLTDSWRTRVDEAKSRHADFEQVALLSPTSIPPGSLIDAWILEHKSGADVLYSLQKDPAELRRVLALPLFEQVDALSLMSQRLSPTRTAAVSTGAAPATPRAPAPRPPTPVRTSAVPAADEPPDPEHASLADHEKYFYGTRTRRR